MLCNAVIAAQSGAWSSYVFIVARTPPSQCSGCPRKLHSRKLRDALHCGHSPLGGGTCSSTV